MVDDLKMQSREISLVDKGANLKPPFPITKAKGDAMSKDVKTAIGLVLDAEFETPEVIVSKSAEMSDKGAGAVNSIVHIADAFADEIPEDVKKAIGEHLGLTPEPVTIEVVKEANVPDEKNEAVFKAQQEQIEVLKAANDETMKALKAEQDARKLAGWVQKAQSDLSHFPGKSADELGAMLKNLEDTNSEVAKTQFEAMKSTSDIMKESDLLKASVPGARENAPDSAWSKLEKLAKSRVDKAFTDGVKISKHQVMAEAVMSNPDLYQAYLDENSAQTT